MTASLYQSGSEALPTFFTRVSESGWMHPAGEMSRWKGVSRQSAAECFGGRKLKAGLKLGGERRFTSYPEDVGGHDAGEEGYVVRAVVPPVVGAGEQVFDVEGFVVADAEALEVEVDPAGLLVVRVEVDGDQDHVGLRCGTGGQAICVRDVEGSVGIFLGEHGRNCRSGF